MDPRCSAPGSFNVQVEGTKMTQSSQYDKTRTTESLVLVVEDEPMIRDFVCEILSDEGWACQAVENADKAVEYLNAHGNEVALLLTDVRMPGSMDGIGLANLVAEKWPEIPIVVMSGHGTPGSDQLKPDVLFIAKPWTINELLSGVQNQLDRGSRSFEAIDSTPQ
ncbi:response regulator [Pseudomonas sp. DWP3-1-2]|uniref:response regulator n=1 Tax=Pseudomonas sp. DWP3-1-2 TaxID=2804645 RepID=UPI003CEDD9EF